MDTSELSYLLVSYFCLLFSLCVHEASHAAAANWCGDPSARLLGRLTLNPIKHIDLIGTVIMPILMMSTGIPYLFGWAKPVPFNPRNLNNYRRDPVIIAIAGPASNLIIALGCAFVLRILIATSEMAPNSPVIEALGYIVLNLTMINILLMLFNVIPVPPLDGHYVLNYFLPPSGQKVLEQFAPFGILIAILVARPWLQISMPIMEGIVLGIATFGRV